MGGSRLRVNDVISTKSKGTILAQPHSTTKFISPVTFIETWTTILLLRVYTFMCFMFEGENGCISGESVGS